MFCAIEFLEQRLMLTFDPSGMEQEMLEYLNHMRMNPAGELDLYFSNYPSPLQSDDPSIDFALQFFEVDGPTLISQWESLSAVAPLAWNAELATAAAGHNAEMISHDDQEHQFPGEGDLGDRADNAGYSWSGLAENIYAYAETVFYGHAGFSIDWGDGSTGIQDPPGHRNNIMNATFRDVGIAITVETNMATDVGPLVITQDFGRPSSQGNANLLGVVFEDLNANDLYTAGEGRGAVDIMVTGTGGTFSTSTWTAGGYQVQVPAGTYTVTASGGGLSQSLSHTNVVVGSDNVKIDFEVELPPLAPTLSAPAAGSSTSDTTPTFGWDAVSNAASYDLWVNDLTTGQSGVIRNQAVSETSFTPNVALTAGHDYIWTVRAITFGGTTGAWGTHRTFSTTVGVPVVTAPGNGSTAPPDGPTFEWQQVSGAARYDIWVNDLTTGQSGVIRDQNVMSTSYTPASALPGGHDYLWTVRAFGANGVAGNWAAHRSFDVSIGVPQLDQPSASGIATYPRPTFTWSAVPGATKYDLWVNNLNTGQSGVIREQTLTEALYMPIVDLTLEHSYLWTVRAFGVDGIAGEWATHRSFTVHIGTPTLQSPTSGGTTIDETPTFEWTTVTGATHYDLWVNDLTTGQSGVVRDTNVPTNSLVSPVSLTAGHSYLWTVRAFGSDDQPGEWSSHRDFAVAVPTEVAAPVLTAPGSSTAELTPQFQWTAIEGASRYDLWVNDLTTGQSGVIRNTNVLSNSYTPQEALVNGHSYIWTVRAYNDSGSAGNWATHKTFTVTVAQQTVDDSAPNVADDLSVERDDESIGTIIPEGSRARDADGLDLELITDAIDARYLRTDVEQIDALMVRDPGSLWLRA